MTAGIGLKSSAVLLASCLCICQRIFSIILGARAEEGKVTMGIYMHEQRMTAIRSRGTTAVSGALGIALLILMTRSALALTVSEFQSAQERFQEGYVWGIVEYLSQVAGDEAQTKRTLEYHRCFLEKKINSWGALELFRAYIGRTPHAATQPVMGLALQCFYEACDGYGIKP
jgi:hypothetical protein